LSFGVGFSTDVGVLFDLGIKENNLLGKGQQLAFKGAFASEKSTANISFTEPYFLDRDIAAGFDAYHVVQDFQSSKSHDTKKTGLGLRAGFPVALNLRQSWRYKIETAKIENVLTSASMLIKAQAGSRTLSEVGHSLAYNKLDSRITPTDGYLLRITNDVAGFGGNIRYFRNKVKAVQYNQLFDNWVFSVKGEVGHILGIDQDVKIVDRFTLGGGNLRGFTGAGVGPRDISTDDSLGGEWRYNGSAQLLFPLGLPSELGVSGRIFSDFGVFDIRV
jgi:outer membrane protein insertion porin family